VYHWSVCVPLVCLCTIVLPCTIGLSVYHWSVCVPLVCLCTIGLPCTIGLSVYHWSAVYHWSVCVPLVCRVPPVNNACYKLSRWPQDMEGSCIYIGEGVRLYHFGQVAKIPTPHKPACYKILHSLRIGTSGGLLSMY